MRISKVLAGVILVLLIVSAIALPLKYYHFRVCQYGIVMPREVLVKSGPANDNETVYALHAGTKVRVTARIDAEGVWYKIISSAGYAGWVREADLEKI